MTRKKVTIKQWVWWYIRLFLIIGVIHFGLLVADVTDDEVGPVMETVYDFFKFTIMLPANLVLKNFDTLIEKSFLNFFGIHLGNEFILMIFFALYHRFWAKASPEEKEFSDREQFQKKLDKSPDVF